MIGLCLFKLSPNSVLLLKSHLNSFYSSYVNPIMSRCTSLALGVTIDIVEDQSMMKVIFIFKYGAGFGWNSLPACSSNRTSWFHALHKCKIYIRGV